MIELWLIVGIIGSLFFMSWLIKLHHEVYEAMTFKDGEIFLGLIVWLFFLLFISTVVFMLNVAA